MEENNTPVEEVNEVQEVGTFADDMPAAEAEQSEATTSQETTPDYSDFLNTISEKAVYNGEAVKFDNVDDAITALQKGMNYDKAVEKTQSLENDPLYKWANDYMKQTGFNSSDDFLSAVKKEQEQRTHQESVDKYKAIYGDEVAEKMAERDREVSELKKRLDEKDSVEQDNAKYTDLIDWHNSMKEKGIFQDDFDVNNIPDEVIQRQSEGVSLKEAYMEHQLENLKTNTEQNTIKKLEENAKTSTGSVKDVGTNEDVEFTRDYIEKMSVGSKGREWASKNMDKIIKSGYFK